MTAHLRRAPARRPGVLVCAGALAVVAVTLVARRDAVQAVSVGAFFSGSLGIVTGATVAAAAGRRPAAARLSLRLLGVAMAVWGVGQLYVGAAVFSGDAIFPSTGDSISSASAPLAVVGLLTAPRPPGSRVLWVRLALDSLLVACCTGLLMWWLTFRDVLFVHGAHAADVAAVAIMVAEVAIVALLLLAWLRDLDRGLALVLVGMTLYTAADLLTMRSLVGGGFWPWQAAVLWCAAWPLVGWGLLRFDPLQAAEPEDHTSDARVTTATTVVALAMLLPVVVELCIRPAVDRVSMCFAAAVVLLFGARETYGGIQRQRLLRTLTELALSDPLTGLGNRRAMGQRLERLDAASRCCVLTVDLDGFKEVNDVLGHLRGDALLVAVSQRMSAVLPPDAQVYRVGGDEFAIVVPGSTEHSERVADVLLDAVRRAADDVPGTRAVSVSASIGLARLVRGGAVEDDVLSVLTESGVALRAAKSSGRDRVETYDGPVAAGHRRQLLIERRLRAALDEGALQVHYQPLLSLATRRVVGVEALARWDDAVLGPVAPDEFIPVAERSGLVARLGTIVMRRAVEDVLALRELPPDLRVAVNVSPVQLRSATLSDEVLALVRATGLAPERLVVEVTESVFVDEEDGGVRHLTRLRAAGIGVAIDDFGSGFSSLAYLGRMPATVLKVDRALTARVLDDPRSLAVMKAVVELGVALPMDVAVEGIETEAVHDVVRDLGAGFGQGWLYAAAVPAADLVALVSRLDAGSVVVG